jgi:hypothetical protein
MYEFLWVCFHCTYYQQSHLQLCLYPVNELNVPVHSLQILWLMGQMRKCPTFRILQKVFKEICLSAVLFCMKKTGNLGMQCGAHDHLCGLVVRLPGCRPRGPGFDSRNCQIF